MSLYRDLLQKDEWLIAAWFGGRTLYVKERTWKITGPLPSLHGWHTFRINGRTASYDPEAEMPVNEEPPNSIENEVCGYLVGDRILADVAVVFENDWKQPEIFPVVRLLPEGLERFARISAGTPWVGGPFVFAGYEMPLGPEEDVLRAFEDQAPNLNHIKGVTPALNAAFMFESWQRAEAALRRLERDRLRREEEARQARLDAMAALEARIGKSEARRELAKIDFETAARAALAISGSEYLSHRAGQRDEFVVRFRFMERRFECVCDDRLSIVDAGICLVRHYDGYDSSKEFTLETLPSVIKEAIDTGLLVVRRHA